MARASQGSVAATRAGIDPASRGTDLQAMREVNRMLVLNCVREYGSIARAEIARYTGLSRTTIGTIMDILLREGLVRESESQRAEASAGRRVIPVHLNAGARLVLGVAMGRNHVTLVLTDLTAHTLARQDLPFQTGRGPAVCLPELALAARAFVERQGDWSRVLGIGVGMPGPIDAALLGPVAPPRMPGWDGMNVRDALQSALEKPIYLDNNANFGALGEIRYGAGRAVSSLLYVKVGTGIGSGLIVDGQIYRGSSGSAGEIGHMTADPHGPQCDCGNQGCLETLAGGPAIVAAARSLGVHVEDMTEVIERALAGDAACVQALRQAAEALGIVLASLVNFFNPALIVVDGSTMRAGDLFLAPVRDTVHHHSLPAPAAHTQITSAALSGVAIALGGVAAVLDTAFSVNSLLRLSFI